VAPLCRRQPLDAGPHSDLTCADGARSPRARSVPQRSSRKAAANAVRPRATRSKSTRATAATIQDDRTRSPAGVRRMLDLAYLPPRTGSQQIPHEPVPCLERQGPCRAVPPSPPDASGVAGSVAGKPAGWLGSEPEEGHFHAWIAGGPAGIRTHDTRIKSLSGRRPWGRFERSGIHLARGPCPWAPPSGT